MVRWVQVAGYVVGVLVLAGCGSSSTDDGDAAATPSATVAPSPTRSPWPEPGQIGSVQGEWEDGTLLGEPLEMDGQAPAYAEILYAARRGDVTYVATGLRDGARTLRTIQALTPDDEKAADGVDLYGGYVLGDRGPDDRVTDGTYLLVGSVPGKVEVSIEGRPVTASSTTTLPGYTVFYDVAAWDQAWDQVQAAPLTVTTSDGRSVSVRERTWTG